jgi:glycerophosphoryl diester phosphodiesterase
MVKNFCQLIVVLFLLIANTASAQDDYGYSLLRIVREQPGEPSKPTIVLPKPFALYTTANFDWASRAEYYVYVTGPKREAKGVEIRWPGAKVAQVIVGDDRLALRREGDKVRVNIPVRHGRLADLKGVAHDAWNTLEIWSFHHEKNLRIQIPHNDPDRAAGVYAEQPWVARQAQSALNFVFASREVIRDWKRHHELAAEEKSFIELMGFETNNPLHGDAPPHWHLSIFWPDNLQTPTAVMCIPHFYIDSAGRVTSNGFSTYGPPMNGKPSKWQQSTLGPDEPALYKDRSGKVTMAITIRKDGGVDLGPDAETVTYSILPGENGTSITRRGEPWRRVRVEDDVKKGVMTVTVTPEPKGNEKPRVEVHRYDPLTGVERKAETPIPVAHRGLLRHAPENTLPAFAACLELGMGFELDIRTTKDGHLVVLHDDSVQRTTNGPSRSVRDMTLVELKRLDAGSWFDDTFAGLRIPTLEETLSLVSERKRGPTIIALNVKHVTREGESKLVALVEKYKLLSESFAFDQSDEMSRRLKKLNPAFRIGQNVNRQSIDARLKEGRLDCFLLTSTPTAEEVSRLHQHGKQVLFNYAGAGETRRNQETWKRAATAGVDGLLTDYPLECRSAWREARVVKKLKRSN